MNQEFFELLNTNLMSKFKIADSKWQIKNLDSKILKDSINWWITTKLSAKNFSDR